MKILVTGGTGFIGSHVADYFLKRNNEVTILDNLSRQILLEKNFKNPVYNLEYLQRLYDFSFVKGDIRDKLLVKQLVKDTDVIIHTAAQTAVTSSIKDPWTDFEINTCGTVNILEAARDSGNEPCLIYCSTNKVYGENVNKLELQELDTRYILKDQKFKNGIPETFPVDQCEHTPYGCSKLAADLYIQDYAIRKEIKAGIFRMSCIYGPRQFGVEDQGWVAWFGIATALGNPIHFFGDGKQVRDILYVADLIEAFDSFIKKREKLHWGVFNLGGGSEFNLSLNEVIALLFEITGKKSKIEYFDWRVSDQKVYISDTRKAEKELGWKPKISPREGISQMIEWIQENVNLFK